MNNTSRTVKQVFDQAQEINSPDERSAFLDRACADAPELREQVEALLRAYQEAGSFLQTPVVGSESTGISAPSIYATDVGDFAKPQLTSDSSDPDFQVPSDATGTQIGPYRLVDKLGEGGMGAVYLAEQEQPIRRQVALKIIKPGLDSAEVVSRFNAERQALTLMEHAHIARVFDAGATDRGLPYFVMELVKGVPLAQFCNENRLSLRERLQLFETICQAIQHAHQKGIIHRDIKPNNVLAAMHDGTPTAKVIDFGLAKATRQTSPDQTREMTRFGAVMGTLEYMSPEQADAGTGGVDTRTDVYALGVMLYELLTGTTPLDFAGHPDVKWSDVMTRIMEEDAPKPSSRVAALGPRLEKIAAARKTDPARLAKTLRGELDWIALKSLEKDRDRRYESASALAKDVQRYLNDEPVEACPPSALYRLGKFRRRHRTLLALAEVIAASVVVVVVVLTVGIVEVNKAREKAVIAQRKAEDEKRWVEEEFKLAESVSYRLNRKSIKLTIYDKKNLRKMVQDFRQIPLDFGDTADASVRIAKAHRLLAVMSTIIGDREGALADYGAAIQKYQELAEEFPDVAQYRHELARCLFNLGLLFTDLGKYKEAEVAYRRAIELHHTLSEEFPTEPLYREESVEENNNLGSLLRDQRELAKAEKCFRRAVAMAKELLQGLPEDSDYRMRLVASHHNLGNAIRDQGKPKTALIEYGKAIDLFDPAKEPPANARIYLRNALWDRANALGQLDRHAEAIKDWQRAIVLDEGADRDSLRCFLAAAQVEEILKSQKNPAAELLYKVAAVFARARAAAIVTHEDGLQTQYTKRALDLLKKARAAGYFNDPRRIQELKADRSFKPLLDDPQGQKFIKQLEAGK